MIEPCICRVSDHDREGRESAVSRVLSWTAIHLGPASPQASSDLPGSSAGHAYRNPIWSCSRWGLPCRWMLPSTRCALTAPFHPYRPQSGVGGLLSAALAVGSRPPGVTWHLTLWSPDFPPPDKSGGDCLADFQAAEYQLCLSNAMLLT